MEKVISDIEELNALFHQPTLHPLMSVGNLSQADLSLFAPINFDMYCVVLMDADFGELVKSGEGVRYQPGTIFSVRPGQVISMNLDYSVKPQGWMLAFKPELLEKSGLGRDFYMFNFFSHDVNEALVLSQAERGIILNSFANIYAELQTPNDYLTNHMLRLGIGHLLSYCKRFFERQFSERSNSESNLRERMDAIIDGYLSSGSTAQQGQPTVAWIASEFNLSPNYFGELVKREMHITAQEYIQRKIVSAAQSLLKGTTMTVNEIAEELGFTYPNHFTRMFRRNTGLSPLQFRKGNKV
jgi:AraC family transcriptional activator of pobA